MPRLIQSEGEAEVPNAKTIEHLKARLQRLRDAAEYVAQHADVLKNQAATSPSDGKVCPQKSSTKKTTDRSAFPSKSNRKNPGTMLYTDAYKGQMLGVPEWVRAAIRAAVKKHHRKPEGKTSREVAVGNLILVLSQLAYWSQPLDKDIPRCDPEWRVEIGGIWWLVLRSGDLAKQTVGDRDAVRRAITRLEKLDLIEIWRPSSFDGLSKRHYGSNTWYVRLRWEKVESAVQGGMKPRSKKRSRDEKSM